jgi:hypothetical protein
MSGMKPSMSFGEEFLSYPDLFPARLAGEPWGDRRVAIDFLGGPYLLSGLDRCQHEAMLSHFGSYCLAEGTGRPEVEIQVFRAEAEDFRSFELSGWDYYLDLDYRPEAVRIAGLDFMGLLEWRPRLAGAIWTRSRDYNGFCGVAENFLRVAAAYHVLDSDGILLHSAALADGTRALVCPGRSGAGKSTLSRLATDRGWQVLSDELNALLIDGSATYVQQVPFAGDFGRMSRMETPFPLQGICRLRRAERDALEPISASEALGVMLSCAPYVNLDPYRRDGVVTVLEKVAARHTAFSLSFSLAGRLAGLDQLLSQKEVYAR